MKGWRPSACPLGSKPVRASLRAKSMPDIGSIGLSLARSSVLLLRDAWVPFLAMRLRGRQVGRKRRPIVRDYKRRQPFTCPMRPEDPETTPKRTDKQPAGEHATPYVRGSRRKSLKRLDSRMESEGFPNLDFVPPDLDFVPPDFDFVPKRF
jgi:hypothetical protein